jgi:hypothetical protein
MQNERYYHPLNILTEVGFIVDFILNCWGFVVLSYQWFAYNISNSDINKYSTTNTFNFNVGKYYMKKMYDSPDFGVSKYWGSK